MSEIKVNLVTPRSGTTVTLGGTGDTIALGTCASQTGFGRTGTVDWCSSIKATGFTAVSGKGYFVNTTSGIITVTLPASPSVGDIVSLKDYANTWDSNNVTVGNNCSPINGVCGTATLNTESQSVTMIYTDATKGWQNIQTSACVTGGAYIAATGGNQPTATGCIVDTNYKVHKFTATGAFCITAGGGPKANADYMVIAGGGGGSSSAGGGGCGAGGAGGYRESHCATTSGPYTASPIASATSLTLAPGPYTITVGGGGAAGPTSGCERQGVVGVDSVFSTITSAGGGGGGGNSTDTGLPAPFLAGLEGGSGGGLGYGGLGQPTDTYKASGNEPPTVPSQGFPGGGSIFPVPGGDPAYGGGGGGGASAAGGTVTSTAAGDGGAGVTTSIDGTPTIRAGGGGGGVAWNNSYGCGGAGGGGNGGNGPPYPTGTGPPGPNAATNGTVNTGGGGGGGRQPAPSCGCGGDGGSGIVIIRYRFQ